MTLICTKTGRFWHRPTLADCERAARLYGLKDYVIEVRE